MADIEDVTQQNLYTYTVDTDFRTIKIPDNNDIFGVVGDICINRVKFEIPRYCSGYDLSEFTARIDYVNANGDPNYYEATEIKSKDDYTISFVWEFASDVTAYAGNVIFGLKMFKLEGSTILRRFKTMVANGVVLDGMDVESYVDPETQKDLLTKMEEKLDSKADHIIEISIADAVETAKKKILDETNTDENIKQIAKNTEDIGSLKEDLDNYDSKMRSFEDVEATEIVPDKLINLKNKEEYDSKGSCYIKQIIPSSIHKIKVSGKSVSAKYDYGLGGFYSDDGILISKFGNDDNTAYTDLELDVPNGASFIYVNQDETSSDTYKKVKFLDVINIVQNKEQTNQIHIDLRKEALNNSKHIEVCQKVITSINIHPQFGIAGYAVRYPNDNSIRFNSANGWRTDYIDVTNYKYIDATLYGNQYIWKVAFFDKDKKFLPLISLYGDQDNQASKLKSIEIPNDAVYVILSTYSDTENNGEANLYNNNSIELKYDSKIANVESRVTELENKEGLLNNVEFSVFKKFGVVGDSLSVGHTVSSNGETTSGRNIYYSWGQYLARRIGNTCLNFGVSGITAKKWMSSDYGYERLVKAENLCQAYIIALGANDTEMVLGTISDVNFSDMSQNADTEYGWYAKVINAVRSVSANAPIFLFTLPHPRNIDAKIKAINEMVRTFANDKEHFGKIFLVDLDADYNDYFKTGKLEAQIGNTGWHLTPLGYLYASYVNQMALSKVISDNYSDFQDVFLLPCGNNDVLD